MQPISNNRYHLATRHIIERPNGKQKAGIRQYKSLNWFQSLFIAAVKFGTATLNKESAKKYLLRQKEHLLLATSKNNRTEITDLKLRRLSNAKIVEYLNALKNYTPVQISIQAPFRATVPNPTPVRPEPPTQPAPYTHPPLPRPQPQPAPWSQPVPTPRTSFLQTSVSRPPVLNPSTSSSSDWFKSESAKMDQEFQRRCATQRQVFLQDSAALFQGKDSLTSVLRSVPLQLASLWPTAHFQSSAYPAARPATVVNQSPKPQSTAFSTPSAPPQPTPQAPQQSIKELPPTPSNLEPFRDGSNQAPITAPVQPLVASTTEPEERQTGDNGFLNSREPENQPESSMTDVTPPIVSGSEEAEPSSPENPTLPESSEKTPDQPPSLQPPKTPPLAPEIDSDSDDDIKHELIIDNIPNATHSQNNPSLVSILNQVSSKLRIGPLELKNIVRETMLFPMFKAMIYPKILLRIDEKDRHHPQLEFEFNKHLREILDIVMSRDITENELETHIDNFKNLLKHTFGIAFITLIYHSQSLEPHVHKHTLHY